MVPAFCDQVVAKQPVESLIGKRNLKISLDIAWEKCTGIFYTVGSGVDHNDGQFFRAMEWLMFFFRPPFTSMVFQWFWYRWTITIECFWRAQPLVSMVFQWFLKFWGQWSTMVWRLTMVCTYHRTNKCVKSIHDKMQNSSRAIKWTSQNISSLDPFKPYIQYNREKATFQ